MRSAKSTLWPADSMGVSMRKIKASASPHVRSKDHTISEVLVGYDVVPSAPDPFLTTRGDRSGGARKLVAQADMAWDLNPG